MAIEQAQMNEFLQKVCAANTGDTLISGAPGVQYRRISFNENTGMYIVSSGGTVSGHNQGFSNDTDFYIRPKEFQPSLEELFNATPTKFKVAGFEVQLNNSWDHSQASNDDHGNARIRYGTIMGELSIFGPRTPNDHYRFRTYELALVSQLITIPLVDRDNEIPASAIEQAILATGY